MKKDTRVSTTRLSRYCCVHPTTAWGIHDPTKMVVQVRPNLWSLTLYLRIWDKDLRPQYPQWISIFRLQTFCTSTSTGEFLWYSWYKMAIWRGNHTVSPIFRHIFYPFWKETTGLGLEGTTQSQRFFCPGPLHGTRSPGEGCWICLCSWWEFLLGCIWWELVGMQWEYNTIQFDENGSTIQSHRIWFNGIQ